MPFKLHTELLPLQRDYCIGECLSLLRLSPLSRILHTKRLQDQTYSLKNILYYVLSYLNRTKMDQESSENTEGIGDEAE